jgi:hypothetical protein
VARDDLADLDDGSDDASDDGFYDEVTERRIEAAAAEGTSAADRRTTRRVAGVRKASGMGAVLTGIAMGLQEVFYPDDDEIEMVVDAEGEPDLDHPVILDFDPTSPPDTRADARPWLFDSDS